jgi:signal transduction histidine kinase
VEAGLKPPPKSPIEANEEKFVITHFAPAERQSLAEVQASRRLLATWPVEHLLECFPGPVAVLNRLRQIVLANEKFSRLAGKPLESLIGLRPGEALDCVHAGLNEPGCGTTRFCRYCGAVQAIVRSQRGESAVEECRLIRHSAAGEAALDLRVWATPVNFGEPYTVFALLDISDEKRRAVLERIFFHDVLNVVSALSGLLELETDAGLRQEDELRALLRELVRELLEQIQSGRDLAAAERGELTVRPASIDAERFLLRLRDRYCFTGMAAGKQIAVARVAEPVQFRSDEILLGRVLGNLLKNALEASRRGETVTLSVKAGAAGVAFSVHNPAAIPEDVQAQLFQRSFSTKEGPGRGIGLYSVKLLAERYLGGTVSFRSSPEEGTTFTVTLPLAGASA